MSTDNNTNNVMKELETKVNAEGFNIHQVAMNQMFENPKKTTEIAKKTADALQNVMVDGAKEFEEKVGRKMTYAEMRAMWG